MNEEDSMGALTETRETGDLTFEKIMLMFQETREQMREAAQEAAERQREPDRPVDRVFCGIQHSREV